jgi:two-component system response regulator CpxR
MESIIVGDVELRPAARAVFRNSRKLTLTSTEFAVLDVLMRNSGQVVTKHTLSESALGRKLGRFDRSLDMHISNVRRKLGFVNSENDRIKTIRNVGYLYTR